MNSSLGLPAVNTQSLAQTTHTNEPGANQQNDQHASQSESMASIQVEFDQECENFEQHLRQARDEFKSIKDKIIKASDALAVQLFTNSQLQQRLSQAKADKAAHLSGYGIEMTAAEAEINTMKSKLDALKKQIRGHYDEQTELRCQGAKKEAEEYEKQHILPLELQRDQLVKDINDLQSKDQQIDSINQEIDKNSKSTQELEATLKNHMRELKLKAGAAYLNDVNDVLALKAAIANLDQDILKVRNEQRDELIQKDAEIAAVREDMKGQMKEQADQFAAQMKEQAEHMKRQNEQLKEVKQRQTDLESQLRQVQFPSSVTPNSIDELLHLIKAPEGSSALLSITSLDLSKCKLGDKQADFFKAVFKMPNLTSLNLKENEIGNAGAQALAASTTFANLTYLNLTYNNIGYSGTQALADSTTLTNLITLDFSYNNIGDAGAQALAASTTLSNLTCLNLTYNNIGDVGTQALAAATTLTNLNSLNLYGNKIGYSGAKALAAATTLTNLTSLNLTGNNIGDDGAKALAASTTLTNLTSLDLCSNNIGDTGAQALAASTTLANLTYLNLNNNIQYAHRQLLAASTRLINPPSNMQRNTIGYLGARALAASTTLTNLITLDLCHNRIGDDGAKALAGSITLTNLNSLNVSCNSIGDAATQAVRAKYQFVSSSSF